LAAVTAADLAVVLAAVDSAVDPEADSAAEDHLVDLVTDHKEALTMALEKCTRQNALNAEMNVKFLSSQQKASQCIAMTVSKNTESFS
jgi:hypothetical protein